MELWQLQGTVRGVQIQRRGVISVLREFGTDLRKWPNAQENSGERLEKGYFELILKVRTDTWWASQKELDLTLTLRLALGMTKDSLFLGTFSALCNCDAKPSCVPLIHWVPLSPSLLFFFLLFQILLQLLFLGPFEISFHYLTLIFLRIFIESLSSDLNFFLKIQSVIPKLLWNISTWKFCHSPNTNFLPLFVTGCFSKK